MCSDRSPGKNFSYVDDPDSVLLKFAMRSFAHCVFHPFELGRTLMQIGHEPIAPWPGKNWAGKPKMFLPNIFQYVGYIKEKEGRAGLYRGVKVCLMEHVVSKLAFYMLTDEEPSDIEAEIDEGKEVSEKERRQWYIDQFIKSATTRSLVLIASHPFHVCAVRSMAQFVGQETKYGDVFGSIRELYRENGVSGFFSGLVPRMLAEICQLIISHSLLYAFITYISREKEHRDLIATAVGIISNTCTYPLLVVSNCMCVSGSGLAAGRYPNMKVYSSWIDCMKNLSEENQLWRGSSMLFWRYDTRPIIKPHDYFVAKK